MVKEIEVTSERTPINLAAVAVQGTPRAGGEMIFEIRKLEVRYGDVPAISGVSMDIGSRQVTAIIGPSGCGKSTFIRCLNRMNDLVPGAVVSGDVRYHGDD